MFSNPKYIYEILGKLLDENMDIDEIVKTHFFNFKNNKRIRVRDGYNNEDGDFITHNGSMLYNDEYGLVFNHDKFDDETIAKYIRRFLKLRNAILILNKPLMFIYREPSAANYRCHKIDGVNMLEGSIQYIEKIYDKMATYRKDIGDFNILYLYASHTPVTFENENIICYNSLGKTEDDMKRFMNIPIITEAMSLRLDKNY